MTDYPLSETPAEDAGNPLPEEQPAEAEAAENISAQQEESAQPIDLNTATKTQLVSLPHIGRTLAQRIIEARPIHTLAELAAIRGISPAAVEDLRPLVTISLPEEGLSAAETSPEAEEPETAEALPTLRAAESLEALEEEFLGEAEPAAEPPAEGQAETDASEELERLEEAVLGQEDTEDLGPIPSAPPPEDAPEPLEEAPLPEEPPAPAASPEPQPAPGGISRSHAWWLAFVSALVTLVLAIVFSLAVLAGINGGLRYAGPQDIRQVSRQVEGVNQQMEALNRDVEGLRNRLDNLEALSGRVDNLERQSDSIQGAVGDLQESLSTMEGDLETLDDSVTSLQTQVDELTQEQDTFQSFFQQLGNLIDEFFAGEGAAATPETPSTPAVGTITPTLTPTMHPPTPTPSATAAP